MPFEELKDNVNDIQENTKAYVESSLAYYKLWGFKVAMQSTTMVLKFLLIAICLTIFLLFISVAAALALGKMLENNAFGFLIIAGIYLIIATLVYFIKTKMIEGSILKKFSEIFFND